MTIKKLVITVEVSNWYHLDFRKKICDKICGRKGKDGRSI